VKSGTVKRQETPTLEVGRRHLNGYGTLFGGFLIGRVWRDTSALLDPVALTLPRRCRYLFERAARLGDRLQLSARVDAVAGVARAIDWVLSRDDDARIASGRVEVCAPEIVCSPPIESALIARRWVLTGDTDSSGLLSPERLAAIADEAAVIYCRERMQVRQVVTRQVSDYVVRAAIPLDEVLEAHCGIVRAGRTSLTVDCRILRRADHAGQSSCARLILSCRLVMVALDAQGRPTLHAQSVVAPADADAA
jgi:acyl-CoA hydrolase